MRIAALVVAVVVSAACKDKTAEQKPAESRNEQKPGKRPALETPEVSGPGLVPVSALSAKITYAKDAIRLNDEPMITIKQDGLVDPQRMQNLITVLQDKVRSDDPIGIALDATLPYFHVAALIGSLNNNGFRSIALLTGTGNKMIPIMMPDAAEASATGLRPVVTIESARIRLWSSSGEEGTKRAPKLDVPLADGVQPLTKALADIVQRRWPDGKRADADRTIIIQVEKTESAENLLRVLAAVRSHGSLELFPNIFLTSGI